MRGKIIITVNDENVNSKVEIEDLDIKKAITLMLHLNQIAVCIAEKIVGKSEYKEGV